MELPAEQLAVASSQWGRHLSIVRPFQIEQEPLGWVDTDNATEVQAPRAVWAVSELPIDEWTKAQFKRRFLGAIGLRETTQPISATGMTLADATGEAVKGNPEAHSLMDINIDTAVSEGCTNDGYYRRVEKYIDASGNIVQFGVDVHQLHYNSYALRPNRSEKAREFTLAEALNGYREQDLLRAGELRDNILLVPSCVPEDMPEAELDARGDGFFTRTMTFCLQATTEEGGKVITESVFRRGTAADEEDAYMIRQARRYDLQAIGMVYEHLGFEPPKTALEFLQNPLLLSKDQFPNGVVDFLRLVDIASDVLANRTAERSLQEYQDMIAESARIDASLADVRAAVKHDLLAAAGTFDHPGEAIHLLWELVRRHGAANAVDNRAIDPSVFGALAKQHIEAARKADDAGDFVLRDTLRAEAVVVAEVTGCGGGACGFETPDPKKAETIQAVELLQPKQGETVVHAPNMPCKECKAVGGVYYAYDKKGYSVACINCSAVAVNGKLQAKKSDK